MNHLHDRRGVAGARLVGRRAVGRPGKELGQPQAEGEGRLVRRSSAPATHEPPSWCRGHPTRRSNQSVGFCICPVGEGRWSSACPVWIYEVWLASRSTSVNRYSVMVIPYPSARATIRFFVSPLTFKVIVDILRFVGFGGLPLMCHMLPHRGLDNLLKLW